MLVNVPCNLAMLLINLLNQITDRKEEFNDLLNIKIKTTLHIKYTICQREINTKSTFNTDHYTKLNFIVG